MPRLNRSAEGPAVLGRLRRGPSHAPARWRQPRQGGEVNPSPMVRPQHGKSEFHAAASVRTIPRQQGGPSFVRSLAQIPLLSGWLRASGIKLLVVRHRRNAPSMILVSLAMRSQVSLFPIYIVGLGWADCHVSSDCDHKAQLPPCLQLASLIVLSINVSRETTTL